MIISTSRRTDIPAYFGEKFYKDLQKGSFTIINPFNNKKKTIFFKKNDIDGIVFWTKNPYPFFNIVKKIKEDGYKFYFHYTLNNYPSSIEPLRFNLKTRIDHLNNLFEIIYPYKIFWRYDPIILNDSFSINFHVESFELILYHIHPFIDKIVVSYLTIYRKIKKFFNKILEDKNIQIELLKKLSEISKKFNKKIYICCYKENLTNFNIFPSKCIDASYFGLNGKKHSGQRPLCNCDKSIDIGFYGTCKTNCLYCYAK